MSFNSLPYALFLPIVVVGSWLLPQRLGTRLPARQLWLLGASWVFYAAWDLRFLALLVLITVVDYVVALRIGGSTAPRARRGWLLVSVAMHLGLLLTFKYLAFFAEQFNELTAAVGLDLPMPVVRLVLPIAISFYTFQSVAYVIDVYRRDLEPTRRYLDHATFVSFFPQLVAGPISRAGSLLPQLQADRRPPDRRRVWLAISLILQGLLLKVAIADSLAPMVDDVFADPTGRGSVTVLAGAIGFTLQLYADFWAYSEIARGSAYLFDIELVRNFRQPFLSRSITEFWQRWHISLSTWLRDYLYIPLGGNRRGRWRTYRNLLLTMLLGGLWHGAGWGFVVWGLIHGVLLAGERLVRDRRRTASHRPAVARRRWWPIGVLASVAATFTAVWVAFVFFRAPTWGDAMAVFGAIGRREGPAPTGGGVATVVIAGLAVLAIDLLARRDPDGSIFPTRRPLRTGLAIGTALTAIIVCSGRPPVPFFYIQF